MKWRLIELIESDVLFNTALDEAILEHVNSGISPPTIRFWKCKPPAISMGIGQNVFLDVDLEKCRSNGVDIVRRKSGGRSDYLSDSDLCYSVFVPKDIVEYNIIDHSKNYGFVCNWISEALDSLGIIARLENKNDIISYGKKIGNAAQIIKSNSFLVHGKIRYDIDLASLDLLKCNVCYANLSNEENFSIERHSLKEHEEELKLCMGSIKELNEVEANKLYEILKEYFLKEKEYEIGTLTEMELKRTEELIHEFYKNENYINGSGNETSRGCCDEYWGDAPKIASRKLNF